MAEPSGPPATSTAFEETVASLKGIPLLPSLILFKMEGVLWTEADPDAETAALPDASGILAALRFKGVRVGVSLVKSDSRKILTKLCAESFEATVRSPTCADSYMMAHALHVCISENAKGLIK